MSASISSLPGPIINWTDSLLVGNEAIDADHRHLFSLAGKVRDGLNPAENANAVRGVLDELLTYANEHFAREEALMKAIRYVGQEEHVVEHRLLTYHLRNLHCQCLNGDALSNGELEIFLDRWLARHILTADLRLAQKIREVQGETS